MDHGHGYACGRRRWTNRLLMPSQGLRRVRPGGRAWQRGVRRRRAPAASQAPLLILGRRNSAVTWMMPMVVQLPRHP
jgi:hypothetical protein